MRQFSGSGAYDTSSYFRGVCEKIASLGKGDFMNYIGFTLLGVLTIICYLVLVRGYYRQRNWVYTAISVMEIVVLSLAASGLLGGGGH